MACEMVLGEIESKVPVFRHDGDSYLGRHVVNARRRPNRWGISIAKEAPKSERKIDAAVAMVIARNARRLVLSSKTYRERKEAQQAGTTRKVWSFS
jgi:phage terminase large subunit-like protein